MREALGLVCRSARGRRGPRASETIARRDRTTMKMSWCIPEVDCFPYLSGDSDCMSWFEESDPTGTTGLLAEGPLCYLVGPEAQAFSTTALSSEAPPVHKVLILSPQHMLPGGRPAG